MQSWYLRPQKVRKVLWKMWIHSSLSTPSLKGLTCLSRVPLPSLCSHLFLPFFLSTFGSNHALGALDLPPDNTASGRKACSCDGRSHPLELFKLMGSSDTWAGHGWLAGSWQPAVCTPAAWSLCVTPTVLPGPPRAATAGQLHWES